MLFGSLLGYGTWIFMYVAGLLIARTIRNIEKKYHIENTPRWIGGWTVAFLLASLLLNLGGSMNMLLLVAFYATVLDWGEQILDLEKTRDKVIIWSLIGLTFFTLLLPYITAIIELFRLNISSGIFGVAFLAFILAFTHFIRKPVYEKINDLFRWKW